MVKKRITITIDPILLDRIDSHINGKITRSRSEAIETLLERQLRSERVAVVLAGGEMSSLLVTDAKVIRPLLEINGITLIEQILTKILNAGHSKVIIVGQKSTLDLIYKRIFPKRIFSDKIEFFEENQPFGTARTLEKVKNIVSGDFLIAPCDTYFDFNLNDLYQFHTEREALATFAIYSRTVFDSKYKGVVELDGFRIASHDEQPEKPKSHLIKTMIAVFSNRIFEYIPSGKSIWRIEAELINALIKDKKAFGYPVVGNWFNIHTIEDLNQLKEYLISTN
ncbi:MAG: sugar phosphate nucleotidyltransferase [Candidatus Hodarchaeales archaeon]|jgi:mannose-1-phosphate guanylyltransferase/phosphomannomutase